MKKVMLAILSVAMLVACQPKSYKLTGTLEGATAERVILKKIRKGQPVDMDTTEMEKGKFTFTGSLDAPELLLVFVDGKPNPAVVFMENKNVSMTGKLEDLKSIKVKGSGKAELFKKFNDEVPGQDDIANLQQEFMQAQMGGDQEKIKVLQEEMQSIMEAQRTYFKKFVDDNAGNEVGAFLALNMARQLDLEALKELIAKFEPALSEHVYVQEMKDLLKPLEEFAAAQEAVAEGKVAPEFTLKSNKGEEVALTSFRGKYLLVDFWASWCGPCRAENPNVVKAYKAYKDKGFEVLSVSVDRKNDDWLKAIEEDGMTWTQVIDDQTVATKYAIQTIPSTFLLDKEGKIIAKNLRGAALEEKLGELLN